MIMQCFNFLNQNSVSSAVETSTALIDEMVDEILNEETIDTSFNSLQFPFANVKQGLSGFENFKSSVAELVAPPPFHDPAGAVGFAIPSWVSEHAPATLICASAD